MCGIGRKDAGFRDKIQRVRDKAKPGALKQLGHGTFAVKRPSKLRGAPAKVWGIEDKRGPTSNIVSIPRR